MEHRYPSCVFKNVRPSYFLQRLLSSLRISFNLKTGKVSV